jgi:large subunit ribosomal protein L31
MKKGIHPKSQVVSYKCACGHTFDCLSTMQNVSLDICSACHPFYTGKQKFVDIAGRVDRFKKRYEEFNKKNA